MVAFRLLEEARCRKKFTRSNVVVPGKLRIPVMPGFSRYSDRYVAGSSQRPGIVESVENQPGMKRIWYYEEPERGVQTIAFSCAPRLISMITSARECLIFAHHHF
mmetsp:Transcript_21662/g.31527  ORF Transcript_21662/g.31527 Transcript_21662/m.31527 type:complete len:105 (-) Transcript_21662:22-336(-)